MTQNSSSTSSKNPSSQDSGVNDDGDDLNSCDAVSIEFDNFFMDYNEVCDSETQQKTISLREYKILLEMVLKVNKLEKAIDKMKNVIRSKDSQLKNLQEVHQLTRNKCIDISKLLTVSNSLSFEEVSHSKQIH